MKRAILIPCLIFMFCLIAQAQVNSQRVIFTGSSTPTSCIPGKVYTTTGLSPAKAWVGTSAGTCTPIDPATAGDVIGPASATDNAIARFDATTGKLIQNSAVTIDDSGSVTVPAGQSVQSPIFKSAAADPADAGVVRLGNNEFIEWEKATTGTDWTLGVNASDLLTTNAAFSALTLTGQGLTSGRVPIIGAAGLITDDADMTFATDTLTVTKLGATTLTGTIAGGGNQLNNVIIGTSTPLAGFFTTLSATGHITAEGVTSTGATGTGKFVFDTAPQISKMGLGQAAGASNPLEITAATDATGIKLLNSSQSPIFDIYTGNANSSARNWRIATNFNSFGSLEFIRGTSQGAAPSSTAVTINVSGDLGVNTTDEATSPTAASFTVAGGVGIAKKVFIPGISASAGLQTAVLCQSSGGEMIADSVACLASSGRFKNQIKPLSSGLKEIMALRPVSFHYKPEGIFANNKNFQSERVGLLAEDVEQVDKRLVGYEKDGVTPRTVGYEQIVPVLISGMQELSAKVDAQQKEIVRLRRLVRRRR